jgi:hypothetical protein
MKPGKCLARGGPRRGHLLSPSPLPPPQFPFSSGASRGRLTGGLEQSRVGVSEMMAGKRRSSCSGAHKLLVNWSEGGIFFMLWPYPGLWCSYSCARCDNELLLVWMLLILCTVILLVRHTISYLPTCVVHSSTIWLTQEKDSCKFLVQRRYLLISMCFVLGSGQSWLA